MSKEYLTLEKKSSLEEELTQLKTVKRKEIAAALEEAKALGDLSENAEYSQAREDQAHLEDRINEIEYILKHAEIAEVQHTGKVEVGSSLIIVKKGEKKEMNITIVGSEESEVEAGKISNEAPLGKALLGKKEGETAEFANPKGDVISYTIKKIA